MLSKSSVPYTYHACGKQGGKACGTMPVVGKVARPVVTLHTINSAVVKITLSSTVELFLNSNVRSSNIQFCSLGNQ